MNEAEEMPTPEWADELRTKFFEQQTTTPLDTSKLAVRQKIPVTCFSTFFGEWEIRENDIIVHLFSRAGVDDKWTEGRYVNRCRNCKSEVPPPRSAREVKACAKCGDTGLIYIPGRREALGDRKFPEDTKAFIMKAADAVWEGNVAIDYVAELRAFAVQLQDAALVSHLDAPDGMLDRFFASLDEQLELAKR